jgi:hypothetical protein
MSIEKGIGVVKMALKKESFRDRKLAESNYNELFSLEQRKKEILEELQQINARLEQLNREKW